MASARWWIASNRTPAVRWRLRPEADLLPPPALLTETHLLGELRAGSRIVGSHHGIVRRQRPFVPVLFRRQVVLGAQVPFQRLELLAILEADDEFRRHRFLHRNGGLQRFGLHL